MSKYATVLARIMQEKGVSVNALADDLGYYPGTVRRWVNGLSPMPKASAMHVAQYLLEDVSVFDEMTAVHHNSSTYGGSCVYPVLAEYLTNTKTSVAALSRATWVDQQQLYKIVHGDTQPSRCQMTAIAEAIGYPGEPSDLFANPKYKKPKRTYQQKNDIDRDASLEYWANFIKQKRSEMSEAVS